MAQTSETSPDVTILMPSIPDTAWERTSIRYAGLFRELEGRHDLTTAMVVGMNSYNKQEEAFSVGYTANRLNGNFEYADTLVRPKVVRDLTMAIGDRPLYNHGSATIVHNPQFNEIVADKANIQRLLPKLLPDSFEVTNGTDLGAALEILPGDRAVVKPATGSMSEGLIIDRKAEIAARVIALGVTRNMMVEAFVETEQGIPELDIVGRHNVRVIMIGGKPIYGFGRLAAKNSLFIADDSFEDLRFHMPDDFPDDLLEAVGEVQEMLVNLPDGQNTVVAADYMRGYQAGEDSRMFLCELNRRPYRNSPYDSMSDGNLWASRQWDVHEAQLLSGIVENRL